ERHQYHTNHRCSRAQQKSPSITCVGAAFARSEARQAACFLAVNSCDGYSFRKRDIRSIYSRFCCYVMFVSFLCAYVVCVAQETFCAMLVGEEGAIALFVERMMFEWRR